MKLGQILDCYKIESLEQLASGKIQDIEHLKLPREVLIEELVAYLLKFQHVQKVTSLRNPPSYLILHTIINEPEYKISVQGFKEKIKKQTELFIQHATKGEGLRTKKDYGLYLRMLQVAWESDSTIDFSESQLLMALREELDISFAEHIILEHHESLTSYWHSDNYYERERNHLIAGGIIHPYEGNFIIAEEMISMLRKTWGYLLTTEQYKRLLSYMSSADLSEILKKNELAVSGFVEEKSVRIIENYIPLKKGISLVGLDVLREIARKTGCQISGAKADLIDNIIDWLDNDEDLRFQELRNRELPLPIIEKKVLLKDAFKQLFSRLSNDQLYNIVSSLRNVRKSGSKERKIQSLWESNYCENTMLNLVSNSELYDLCAKSGTKVFGTKQEKTTRIINHFSTFKSHDESEKIEEDAISIIDVSTQGNRESEKQKQSESIDELKKKYPFLSSDELIILSFILENKTASGPIVERLVARFNLPWYFPETQMTEMIKKLKDNGQDIIAVQKYSDFPLYQLK